MNTKQRIIEAIKNGIESTYDLYSEYSDSYYNYIANHGTDEERNALNDDDDFYGLFETLVKQYEPRNQN